jgi:hypothetical protein
LAIFIRITPLPDKKPTVEETKDVQDEKVKMEDEKAEKNEDNTKQPKEIVNSSQDDKMKMEDENVEKKEDNVEEPKESVNSSPEEDVSVVVRPAGNQTAKSVASRNFPFFDLSQKGLTKLEVQKLVPSLLSQLIRVDNHVCIKEGEYVSEDFV